ncbi:MAG TPA: cupin domain-containing protein [Verrucomicrobiales bacterium]|nr:cupin domain-containing protein [Verrucomicrobiales bacterium]
MKRIFPILAAAVLAIYGASYAQNLRKSDPHDVMEATIHRPAEIEWQEGPPSLPPGAKFAVLEGDPAKEGFFTMRIWLPDGYRIPPHTHPKTEHVTVISGAFNLGMGEKFDLSAATQMPQGAFGFWPAGMKHFAFATGETVLQLHGIAPWTIEYLDPADDPRIR